MDEHPTAMQCGNTSFTGGYRWWFCDRRRHWFGRHRYRNYSWGGLFGRRRVKYDPVHNVPVSDVRGSS